MTKSSVMLHAQFARRFPAPPDAPSELAQVETHILRVRANEIPEGIPDDANPREPNLNRQVYKRVTHSLLGEEGAGSFHLKHGGIVLIADSVVKVADDTYRVTFENEAKQGVANGNHSYALILAAREEDVIPDNQYVEIKVHVGVPIEIGPDLADGLNTSMQVREESLADLRGQFAWLQRDALAAHPRAVKAISWHEGDPGEYDVREVIALLMALDPTRYPLADAVGVENAYARLSSMFRSYLVDTDRVEGFKGIAVQAMELYEYIRYTAPKVWGTNRFAQTKLADTRTSGQFTFPFLVDGHGRMKKAEVRLTKAAAIPCFAAFRALVDVAADGTASWRYPFPEITDMWSDHGTELLREVHDAVMRQHAGNTHYAGRSPMLYRATAKTLELVDLRRRVNP